jgi:hypothetical protein
MAFLSILTTIIITNPYVSFQGIYKPHCKKIMLSCITNTTLYTSYHDKPLCEGEVIVVDKLIVRGIYYEQFYLHQGTRIDTPHKVFELYEFNKWLKYKTSKLVQNIDKDGIYVIVSEVPYMKYTIRKSTFCKKNVDFVCGNTFSPWLTINDYHFLQSDKDFFVCK